MINAAVRRSLHGLAKCLVWQRGRERRFHFDDGGLAVKNNRLGVVAEQLALTVVRIVELAKSGLFGCALRQGQELAGCSRGVHRSRRVRAVEGLELLVRLVRAVSVLAVQATGIAAVTLMC